MFSWKEIIQIAIRIEQNGEQTYRTAAEKVKDPQLSRALSLLADEEAQHTLWLSQLTPTGKIPDHATDFEKLARVFLRETVADQPFSLQEVDLTALKSVEKLMETSIAFERDTIQFYEMIRHFADNQEVDALFETIIAEEKSHVQKLKQGIGALTAS